jgi:hypothetical protein
MHFPSPSHLSFAPWRVLTYLLTFQGCTCIRKAQHKEREIAKCDRNDNRIKRRKAGERDISSTWNDSSSAYGAWGWGSKGTTRTLNAKRFKGAILRMSMSTCLQEDGTSLESKQVEEFTTTASRARTYILERTWDFFTRRPDEPCSRAARLATTDSGAAPLRPTTLTAALRSPAVDGEFPST